VTHSLKAGLCAGLLLALAPSTRGADQPKPRDLGFVEETEQRLVQLDVSLRAKKPKPGEALPELTLGDFEVVIAGHRIALRYADRLCQATSAGTPPAEAPLAAEAAPAPPTEPERAPQPTGHGTYLFYFEHKHLTMQGQEIALKMAEELIPKLIVGGNRGMVASSGARLIQSKLSGDPQVLLEALQSIRHNTGQWSATRYSEAEIRRYQEIREAEEQLSVAAARSRARLFQVEEIQATSNQLRRFAAVLGSLAEIDAPKVALYFADTIRKSPGQHYAELFGGDSGGSHELATMETKSFSASAAFDRVTEMAGAMGVRLYTIQAQGLSSNGMQEARFDTNSKGFATHRLKEAEDTMTSLAAETGGATFRGGLDNGTLDRVLGRIQSDLDCFWLLSFPAEGLAQDQILPVRVRFNPDSPRFAELDRMYELSSRGQIVVQSASQRKESMLLAAHLEGGDALESEPARGTLIPLAFKDGKYRALVQLVVANPAFAQDLAGSLVWDLGLTHVARDKVEHQVAQRIESREAKAPVVLEAEWSFAPGKGEIVGVAYENRFGQVATVNIDVDWPDPDDAPVTVGPLALVQPSEGAFVRLREDRSAKETRNKGTLALGSGAALVDRPTWAIGLLCRGRRTRGDLWIERRLTGASSIDFPVQKWEWDADEPCVQVRDLIEQGVMDWGTFKYEVQIYDAPELAGEPLATKRVEFTALTADEPLQARAP
jgi:hypothetical protein